MKSSFSLGPGHPVSLPKLIDSRLLIQANSGGGKSWCIRRILEQTHGKVQHIVIDLEGEFASLREHYDYVLASKRGGDTAADVRSAKLLAERLLELRVSAILDIYELKHDERITFVKTFLEALVNAPKKLWHPALVVVDEAHVFCPEGARSESSAAVIDLATRGRKRGFCAVLATQRLSKLNKDAAAECNNKLIGRTGLDVDVKRAADELGFPKTRHHEFRKLHPGCFFAFGPAISIEVEPILVGPVRTSHPKAGARIAFTAPPPTAKVKALLPKLADLPAEQAQRVKTEQELRDEIRKLKQEVSNWQSSASRKQEKIAAIVRTKEKRVPFPVLRPRDVERIEMALDKSKQVIDALRQQLERAFSMMPKTPDEPISISSGRRPLVLSRASAPPEPPVRAVVENGKSDHGLRGRHMEILRSLARYEQMGERPVSNARLAASLGLSFSGTFNGYLAHLSTGGFVERTGGTVRLTLEGRRQLTAEDLEPHSHEEIVKTWNQKLAGKPRQIFNLLLECHPQSMSNEQMAEAMGVKFSGTFNGYLAKLSTLGLIERGGGHAKASALLFPEGE